MTRLASIAAMALACGFFTTPASATPVGNVSALQADVGGSIAEQINYRRCRWHNGHRHCSNVERYGYGPSVGVYVGERDRGHRGHRDRDDRGRNHR